MDANGDFKTGSTPAVVPGAAPALAKAGVGGFFRRHLEDWNEINRSQEERRNISRKLEWTRDSPQSQIAPTVADR